MRYCTFYYSEVSSVSSLWSQQDKNFVFVIKGIFYDHILEPGLQQQETYEPLFYCTEEGLQLELQCKLSIWATSWQNQQNYCAQWRLSEDSDQQIRPVWSEYSLSAGRKLGSLATHWAHSSRLWSDWEDVQIDLSLRWMHSLSWGGSIVFSKPHKPVVYPIIS